MFTVTLTTKNTEKGEKHTEKLLTIPQGGQNLKRLTRCMLGTLGELGFLLRDPRHA